MSKKRTKAQLERELTVANEKLAQQERNGVLFMNMALKQSQAQSKELTRQKKKTKKLENRLNNIYNIGRVLRSYEDRSDKESSDYRRLVDTIIRLASGR